MRGTDTLAEAFPQAVLRPMSSANELAVAEAAGQAGTRPERVTAVLNAVYQTIAGQTVTLDLVRRLPCGTREWLLQRAAHHFQPELTWFEAACTNCGRPYDLSLKLAEGARRRPARGVSAVEVETSLGPRSFQVPNGGHEEAFARQDPARDPRRAFAALCGQSEHAEDEAQAFNEDDLSLIDKALEAASPDVSDEAQTTCPSCGSETAARIDPLLFAFPREQTVLQAVHAIATAYGWPLDQILGLPVRQRTFFAAMIAQDRRRLGRLTGWRSA